MHVSAGKGATCMYILIVILEAVDHCFHSRANNVSAGKGATGIYILIVMAVALATYIAWRFWEAITGQVPCSCA